MDTKKVERIEKSAWMNSHLSLARLTGAVTISGVKYILHPISEQLVRQDIYELELKAAKAKKKSRYKEPHKIYQLTIW